MKFFTSILLVFVNGLLTQSIFASPTTYSYGDSYDTTTTDNYPPNTNYYQDDSYAKDAFITPKGDCKFDLDSYTGGWFEVVSSYVVGQTLESGCICPVAYYTANKTYSDNIDVTNSCIRNGQYWKMPGYAYPAKV